MQWYCCFYDSEVSCTSSHGGMVSPPCKETCFKTAPAWLKSRQELSDIPDCDINDMAETQEAQIQTRQTWLQVAASPRYTERPCQALRAAVALIKQSMSAAHSHSGRVASQVVQQQRLPAGPRCPRGGRGAQVQVDQLRGLREAAAGAQQARRQKLECVSERSTAGQCIAHGQAS